MAMIVLSIVAVLLVLTGIALVWVICAAISQGDGERPSQLHTLALPLLALPLVAAMPAMAQTGTPSKIPIVLAWDAPTPPAPPLIAPPIDGYNMYRLEVPTTAFAKVGNVAGNVLTFTDASVTAGKLYSYRVTAFNGSGESGPSNVVTAAPFGPPGAPQNTRITITINIQ